MTHQEYINLLTTEDSRDLAIKCSSIQQRIEVTTYLSGFGWDVEDDYCRDPEFPIEDWPYVLVVERYYDEDDDCKYLYCDVGSPEYKADMYITYEEFFGCEVMSDEITSVEDVI